MLPQPFPSRKCLFRAGDNALDLSGSYRPPPGRLDVRLAQHEPEAPIGVTFYGLPCQKANCAAERESGEVRKVVSLICSPLCGAVSPMTFPSPSPTTAPPSPTCAAATPSGVATTRTPPGNNVPMMRVLARLPRFEVTCALHRCADDPPDFAHQTVPHPGGGRATCSQAKRLDKPDGAW